MAACRQCYRNRCKSASRFGLASSVQLLPGGRDGPCPAAALEAEAGPGDADASKVEGLATPPTRRQTA
eukprot:scaffold277_cov261-Pinguiococcus_pyrenoidosus.AAC.18